MLDPRSGSIFWGGISISSIYRLDIADFAGPQIDSISSIYRRVDISTIYRRYLAICHIFLMYKHGVKGSSGPGLKGSDTQVECSLDQQAQRA